MPVFFVRAVHRAKQIGAAGQAGRGKASSQGGSWRAEVQVCLCPELAGEHSVLPLVCSGMINDAVCMHRCSQAKSARLAIVQLLTANGSERLCKMCCEGTAGMTGCISCGCEPNAALISAFHLLASVAVCISVVHGSLVSASGSKPLQSLISMQLLMLKLPMVPGAGLHRGQVRPLGRGRERDCIHGCCCSRDARAGSSSFCHQEGRLRCGVDPYSSVMLLWSPCSGASSFLSHTSGERMQCCDSTQQ